jgi:hypothetical protein
MLHTLPHRYLMTWSERPMVVIMPMPDIVLKDTPEDRKAHRIASMMHSANVLDQGRLYAAAAYLRAKAAALKYGVPDGCESFSDDADVDVEVVHG